MTQRERGVTHPPHGLLQTEPLSIFNAPQHDLVHGDQSGFDKIIAGGQEEIAVLPNA